MKQYFTICFLILFFPVNLPALDWKDRPSSDFKKWHIQIENLIDTISENTPQKNKDGYYWYFYGTMKNASYCIKEKIVLQGKSLIKNAEACCGFLFQSDLNKIDRCKTILQELQNGPLDDNNQINSSLNYMSSQTNKGSGINAADNITPLSE